MPNKLFISYRSLDSAKVDALVARLHSLKHADGSPRYDIWQDKTSIPVGHDWWKAIVQGIIDCDVFVYMLSSDSAQSINCRAELSYARKRNRPIIPLVLEGAFEFNPKTGKNDIPYWEHIPQELNDGRFQFLFYEGTSFVGQIDAAVDRLVALRLPDLPAPEPPDPRDADDTSNDTALIYDQAVDYAGKLQFAPAEKLFQRLLNWNDPLFADEAREWIVLLRNYEQMVRLDARSSTRHKIPALWAAYAAQFPRPFVELFDPKGFKERYQEGSTSSDTPPAKDDPRQAVQPSAPPDRTRTDSAQAAIQRAHAFKGQRNRDWQPYIATFADLRIPDMPFCLVPVGTFNMGSNEYDREKPVHPQTIPQPYWIAQYPVTNAQWQQAVAAGAVKQPKAGDTLKWYNDPAMSAAPVVGIDWFMARDFAAWMGCRLPTELEWEYAARGVESLRYPWGEDWNPDIPVWSQNSGGRPAVVTTRPEGQSWVGAQHLSGNVWEWTSSEFKAYPYRSDDGRERDTGSSTDVLRVLRGGSWDGSNSDYLRAGYRNWYSPDYGYYGLGFRCARSPK
jgi:formylglycine-generating enzyme required for sulfatase activity